MPEEWKNIFYGGSVLNEKIISVSDDLLENPLSSNLDKSKIDLLKNTEKRFGYFVFKNVLVMEYPTMDAFVDIWQLCTDIENDSDYYKLLYFHELSAKIENDP